MPRGHNNKTIDRLDSDEPVESPASTEWLPPGSSEYVDPHFPMNGGGIRYNIQSENWLPYYRGSDEGNCHFETDPTSISTFHPRFLNANTPPSPSVMGDENDHLTPLEWRRGAQANCKPPSNQMRPLDERSASFYYENQFPDGYSVHRDEPSSSGTEEKRVERERLAQFIGDDHYSGAHQEYSQYFYGTEGNSSTVVESVVAPPVAPNDYHYTDYDGAAVHQLRQRPADPTIGSDSSEFTETPPLDPRYHRQQQKGRTGNVYSRSSNSSSATVINTRIAKGHRQSIADSESNSDGFNSTRTALPASAAAKMGTRNYGSGDTIGSGAGSVSLDPSHQTTYGRLDAASYEAQLAAAGRRYDSRPISRESQYEDVPRNPVTPVAHFQVSGLLSGNIGGPSSSSYSAPKPGQLSKSSKYPIEDDEILLSYNSRPLPSKASLDQFDKFSTAIAYIYYFYGLYF